ncbi:MAG: hypothetical protein AAGI37_18185 [Planctomycetota bacterium]
MSTTLDSARQREHLTARLREQRAMARHERDQARRDQANQVILNRSAERAGRRMRDQGYSPEMASATRYSESLGDRADRQQNYLNAAAQRQYMGDVGRAEVYKGRGAMATPYLAREASRYEADVADRMNFRDNQMAAQAGIMADLASQREFSVGMRGHAASENVAAIEAQPGLAEQQRLAQDQVFQQQQFGRPVDPGSYVGEGKVAPYPDAPDGRTIEFSGKDYTNQIYITPDGRRVSADHVTAEMDLVAQRQEIARQNPQQSDESDDAYIARLQSIVDKTNQPEGGILRTPARFIWDALF